MCVYIRVIKKNPYVTNLHAEHSCLRLMHFKRGILTKKRKNSSGGFIIRGRFFKKRGMFVEKNCTGVYHCSHHKSIKGDRWFSVCWINRLIAKRKWLYIFIMILNLNRMHCSLIFINGKSDEFVSLENVFYLFFIFFKVWQWK